MISNSKTGNIPPVCSRFVNAFEELAPVNLENAVRQRSLSWNGERLFLHYDWVNSEYGAIAVLRFQFAPMENLVWIGSIEVHPLFRARSTGTKIVRAVEGAARQGKEVDAIRLFSRRTASGFWKRIGFLKEADPRYFRKTVACNAACTE